MGPKTENTDGRWQRCPYQPDGTRLLGPAQRGVLGHTHMCDGHRGEEKTHWKDSQRMAGVRDKFFPRIWLEGGTEQFSLSLSGLVFVALLAALQAAEPCSAGAQGEEQQHTLPRHFSFPSS